MKTLTRASILSVIAAMALYACLPPATPTSPPSVFDGTLSSVGLSVVAINGNTAFNTVGQVINYSYTVTNTGSVSLAGPVTIADDRTTVPVCALVNSVGNGNNNLDTGESVICTSSYTITQADLTAGSVTSNAVARVGGVDSNRVTTTVRMAQSQALTVSCTANPANYSAAGQTITFTYTVRNTSAAAIGPAQFTVQDSLIPAPINCGAAGLTLGPNETVTCTGTYATTQTDLSANQITNSVTASGGSSTSAAASCPVARSGVPVTVTPGGAFTKGSTIQHRVVKGEWLLQIARCYAVNVNNVTEYTRLLQANPTITNPNLILPDMTVTVPNVGSNNTPIYGPPCAGYHVVQSGETLDTIRTKYNAALDVLQAANRNVTFGTGVCLRIPLNSAFGSTPAQTALTACPGTSTPIPTERDPIRITIPAGSNSATLTNTVDSTSRVRFLLATTQGQTLTVKVTAAANEVSMGVVAANGTSLKAQDTNLNFTGTITVTGDTTIDIRSVTGTTSKSFQLDVTLTSAPATALERVADINTGINNSDPAYLEVFDNILYFRAAGSDNAGAELWKYDPTPKTASRVADIVVGSTGSDPSYLTTFNGALYFRANGNDGGGAELWRFNGSATGRLTDINPGSADANPSHMAVFNNMLYFSAVGGDGAGVELWRTDGTTAVRAADINAGPGDSNPSYLTVFNNALYFSAVSTDGAGVELWKYDGTNAPSRVADINPGVGNSNPAHLAVFNNVLYFSANANDGAGIELWKYDGTNPPTRVADINAGAGDSAPSFLAVFNNALYFSANGNDGAGTELWKYDGTATTRVSDINTAGNANPSYLVVFNNELYFQANSNDGAGTELWKFKGP